MADTFENYLLAITSQLAVPVTVIPTTSSSVGTVTSGTAETLDAVLGTYQASLIAGRRYLAIMNGIQISGTAAGDLYKFNIRNSGSNSTPTTGSTLVAQTQAYVIASGGPGQVTVPLAGSFLAPSTGLNTFGMFTQRAAGTGTASPVGTRELYVMYLGVV